MSGAGTEAARPLLGVAKRTTRSRGGKVSSSFVEAGCVIRAIIGPKARFG
jgi:hypothetical protein